VYHSWVWNSECPNILEDTFSFEPFSKGYFRNKFVYQRKQSKEIFWNQRMVSISSVEATNHQYQHQLQASNTISFASLSAHCHHSDCSDSSVLHLGKIPKRQQNKEKFWWKIIWIWRLCVLATTTTKSHILCPFQVLKEELHWNRIEQKKKKMKQKRNMSKKQQWPLDSVNVGQISLPYFSFNQINDWNIKLRSTTTLYDSICDKSGGFHPKWSL